MNAEATQAPLDGADPDDVARELAAEQAAAAAAEPPGGPEPGDGSPLAPEGRLRCPESTNGVYLVLWAAKPKRGDKTRPSYAEAAYVRASNPDVAKRRVVEGEDDTGAFLRHQAGVAPGILVRAVPAMHWPDKVEATTFERPAPILTVR